MPSEGVMKVKEGAGGAMTEKKPGRLEKGISILFLAVLILYPLRHLSVGVDLWDGGYNYANFRYPGMEYMDSMWYFATWIANVTGSLLGKLPFGDRMLAMNLYTGLFVSLLATAGFLFCTKILKLPSWLAFLGEFTACGLCWLPTASLYNYVTFVLLAFGCILLYLGLIKEQAGYLAAAGALLGLNVGVRFSNLVQAALILAVWSYGGMRKKSFREICRQTLVCAAGYAAGLGAFLLLMAVRYGISEYAAGILRLFDMTESAKEYSPSGMLAGVAAEYAKASYWIKRFGLALAVGTAVCGAAPGRAVKIRKFLCCGVTLGLFGWLLTHRFFYPDFHTYQAIYDPCVMLLLSAMAVSGLFLIKRNVPKEDKLLAVMELLLILLTSLGGNNAVFYCINNMFLILPLHIYMLWKLWREPGMDWMFSVKTVSAALALLVCVLAVRFGNVFIYEEAGGARQADTVIAEIPVLSGMRTHREKAEALTGLYRYLRESGLSERSCILYGQIPGVSYYLELAPAVNIWSDLESYTWETMSGDLEALAGRLKNGAGKPVVILERSWAEYLDGTGGADALWTESALKKAELLKRFLGEFGYARVYDNGKFAVYGS